MFRQAIRLKAQKHRDDPRDNALSTIHETTPLTPRSAVVTRALVRGVEPILSDISISQASAYAGR